MEIINAQSSSKFNLSPLHYAYLRRLHASSLCLFLYISSCCLSKLQTLAAIRQILIEHPSLLQFFLLGDEFIVFLPGLLFPLCFGGGGVFKFVPFAV